MAGNSKSSKASTKPSDEADQPTEERIDSAADETPDTESVEEVLAEDEAGTGDADETLEAESGESDPTAEPVADETSEVEDTSSIPGVLPAHATTEPVSAPAASTPVAASSGPGAFAMVFGGLVAGAIGFLVATFAVPEGWPNPPAPVSEPGSDELAAQLTAQAERLEELSAELAALWDAPPVVVDGGEEIDLGPLTDRLQTLETSLSDVATSTSEGLTALSDQFAAFDGRLAEVEARPETVVPDGSAAMEAQMEDFRQRLDAVTADAEARIAEAQNRASEIEAEAAAAAEASERQAALAAVRASVENGTPFAEPLSAFDAPPEALVSVAGKGVPTMSSLQDEFPAAARAALSEVQSVPGDASAGERLTAFLRRQTNARSLAPRDGSDPDAILSRAEAAVTSGDLDTALTELSALPESAQSAMSGWISAAETRAEAMAAVSALETESN